MSNSPFGNRENNAVWCRIAGGKVVRSATETTPNAVKVEKKKNGQGTGEFRWELHDDEVKGRIIAMRTRTDTYGGEEIRQMILTLDYVGIRVNVSFKEGDRYWRALVCRLPNIDALEMITLAPYDFEPKDGSGRKIGLSVLQNGKKVEAAFTRENPGQLPQMTKVMYKGKERPDFTAQDEWLNTNVVLPFNTKLSAIIGAQGSPLPEQAPPPATTDDDDLPFCP